jgi:hypothetical protein
MLSLFTCDACGTCYSGPDPCPVCPTLTPKDVVCDELGFRTGVSVRRGRGAAHSWIYIKTSGKVDQVLRDTIENRLMAAGVCGMCYGEANVIWSEQ